MATLKQMPLVTINEELLLEWGKVWNDVSSSGDKPKNKCCFDKKQGMDFSKRVIDPAVAQSLSIMLGGIPIEKPISNESLLPPKPDCIELGNTRIIGGVRPQNFDIAYRPDGLRIVYDSKTLNDAKSIQKNWQNMINDLATEATTVHIRFPYAIVAFVVVIPKPALNKSQEYDIIRTLERLGTRKNVQDPTHLAEVVSLIIWDPSTGQTEGVPDHNSILRIEKFSEILCPIYFERYKGLPPHNKSE